MQSSEEFFKAYKRIERALGVTDFSSELIHYTGLQKLVLMLESKQLWFGRLDEVNDLKEVDHYLQGVTGAVAELIPEVPREFVEQLAAQIRSPLREQTYVSCWCEHIDPDGELPMWNLYAREGDGIGIVVDASQFQPSNLEAKNLGFFLNVTRVEYAKLSEAANIARRMVRQLSTLGAFPIQERVGFVTLLLTKAVAVKHHSFASEKEVRFLSVAGIDAAMGAFTKTARTIPAAIQPRSVGARTYLPVALAPYGASGFDLSVGRVLRKIVVGPGGDQDARVAAARRVLDAHGLTAVPVQKNGIPFR